MTPKASSALPLTFYAIAEPWPGPGWQDLFNVTWPAYRSWYLREGSAARPGLPTCRRMLERHMPELVPTWHRLCELAGGGELAARMLTLYNPPAYLVGCSQAVHLGSGGPALVRNYDYAPLLCERVVLGSAFTGRRVVGMSDCLWGLLDGVNDAGLAASLAFGGRRAVGSGFGIPLVVRYLLEVCETADDARRTLARLPVHMAYNLTVVDRTGDHFTAFLGPDREPRFVSRPYATNHQEHPDWPEQAHATHSLERLSVLTQALDRAVDLEQLVAEFLSPPLYSTDYELGFGTLYTAVYRPVGATAEYRWPGSTWRHAAVDVTAGEHHAVLGGEGAAQVPM
ncbi:MAG TPA: C45 family peptidase [Jiangellaceae bacterium]|nr:C45 family peptidase [Jiangellaceae bacterium]